MSVKQGIKMISFLDEKQNVYKLIKLRKTISYGYVQTIFSATSEITELTIFSITTIILV
jgi:hypothetical protein